jgi:hypothetical protein
MRSLFGHWRLHRDSTSSRFSPGIWFTCQRGRSAWACNAADLQVPSFHLKVSEYWKPSGQLRRTQWSVRRKYLYQRFGLGWLLRTVYANAIRDRAAAYLLCYVLCFADRRTCGVASGQYCADGDTDTHAATVGSTAYSISTVYNSRQCTEGESVTITGNLPAQNGTITEGTVN